MWIDSGDDDDDGDAEDDVDDAVVEDVDGNHDGDDPSASVNAFPPLPFSSLLCMWMRADIRVLAFYLFLLDMSPIIGAFGWVLQTLRMLFDPSPLTILLWKKIVAQKFIPAL